MCISFLYHFIYICLSLSLCPFLSLSFSPSIARSLSPSGPLSRSRNLSV